MIKKLTVFTCSYLAPEIAHVIKNGDFPDVQLLPYVANCAQNTVSPSSLSGSLLKLNPETDDICVIGNTCFAFSSFKDCKFERREVHLEQCFEVFLNKETVAHYIGLGYYLVTNGWLRLYQQHIKSWGFTDDTSRLFFGESMKGILLLDTQIDNTYLSNLEKLSDYMGLPYEILPVGLSHCQDFFNSLVFDWRNKIQTQRLAGKMSTLTRQSADYATIFHQLEILVNLTDEKSIVDVSFQLLSILYAPTEISFKQFINDQEEVINFERSIQYEKPNIIENFSIDVMYANTLLGVFEIKGIMFPQFIDEYKKTGSILKNLFGLAIANARKYEITIEQKKQLEIYSAELLATNNAKDKFFSILAHDLRGPLGSALGWSDMLNQEIDSLPVEQVKKISGTIYNSISSTFNLLTNLLDWARTQTGKIDFIIEPVNMRDVLEEVYYLLSGQAQLKSINITHQIPKELMVYADRNMLTTIIRNLVSNAIKYTHADGKISISCILNNHWCTIGVSDNGVGMTQSQIDQLFSVENTISSPGTNKEKGTGLGLVLCKEFVEKHEGNIWVESQVGIGSTFYFKVPVSSIKGLKSI